jgi:hypothetical protein
MYQTTRRHIPGNVGCFILVLPQSLETYLKIGHEPFIPWPPRFNIHNHPPIMRRMTCSVYETSFKQRNFSPFQESPCILSVGTSVRTFVSAIAGTCPGGYQLISSSKVNTCGPQLCVEAGQLQNVNPVAGYICTYGVCLQNQRRYAVRAVECIPVWGPLKAHCFARRYLRHASRQSQSRKHPLLRNDPVIRSPWKQITTTQ